MTVCPTCRAALPVGAVACPKCDTSVAPGSVLAFAPGQVLGDRYRIVALLGRGGMGSVYRADDLRLGQTIALKFLSPELANDPVALQRLHAEVRTARQVSHPHVCRVHDLDMVAGQYFLTMEYVDGEDLGVLLRRIGRLAHDKAIEIARQLCAGLQAAHERGVIHRDLKPGNVMLDGRGRVRITDFGLAVSPGEATGGAAGTPAYMAPEQTLGRPATVQSDLYALGLVLYELCTGRHPFAATTLDGWLSAHREQAPPDPAALAPGLDGRSTEVILRCLAKDPTARPASAAQVAWMLPGGDPLAAAVAAGETPSPEMVAEATGAQALSRRASLMLAAAVVALLSLLLLGSGREVASLQPFGPSREVLADRQARLLGELGLGADIVGRASGFAADSSYLDWAGDPRQGNARWERLRKGQPLVYYFWYRQSPVGFLPRETGPTEGRVRLLDPPATLPGMSHVITDVTGRLVEFGTVPTAALAASAAPAARVDWLPLFRAAGLDPARFTRCDPQELPPVFADERCAWRGALADHQDLTVRIEAAALGGQPVSFRIAAPWHTEPGGVGNESSLEQANAGKLGLAVLLPVLLGAVLLVRRNLRAGRSDRRGAQRLAVFQASAAAVLHLLANDLPLTTPGLISILFLVVSRALVAAAVAWLLYLALEPAVRRHQPRLLVAWTRLLAGRWADPLVGRDLLIGAVLGLCCSGTTVLGGWAKFWTDHPLPPNHYADLEAVGAFRQELAAVLGQVPAASIMTLGVVAGFVLLRRILPHGLLASALMWGLAVLLFYLGGNRSWPLVVSVALTQAVMIGTMVRLGLLAGAASLLVWNLTTLLPVTTNFQLPQGRLALLALAATAGLAGWGIVASRALAVRTR